MTGTILVINPGSSTLKLGLLGPDDEVLRQSSSAAGAPGTQIDEFLAGAVLPAACGVRVVHGERDKPGEAKRPARNDRRPSGRTRGTTDGSRRLGLGIQIQGQIAHVLPPPSVGMLLPAITSN